MTGKSLNLDNIYTTFQPKIIRYLTGLIGAKDAEDVTQEVFIKIGKSLATFRNEAQLSTWIYRIATNAAMDRIRNTSFKRELIQPSIIEDSMETEISGVSSTRSCSLEEQLGNKETSECIRGVIDKLPENYRLIVILSELEGLQNKEIAEILGLSLDVVKVRLHRGKARLKQELQNYCNFYWDERNEFTCDPKGSNK